MYGLPNTRRSCRGCGWNRSRCGTCASLYGRIGRHNARSMLISLAPGWPTPPAPGWCWTWTWNGWRWPAARRWLRDGYYYSKAATLDAYELLRQLIDGTDELEGLFLAVLLPPELVNDEGRGLPAYTALRMRVVDEVRDRYRVNPYSTLVRIGPAEVAA